MLTRLINHNIIRRFNHIQTKSTFPENKIIEDLLHKQNEYLNKISTTLNGIYFFSLTSLFLLTSISIKHNK